MYGAETLTTNRHDMPYQPKRGGTKYRQLIARGRTLTRRQRSILERIIEQGPTQAELFQLLTAMALLTSQIDEVLEDLAQYDEKDDTDTQ